MKTFKVLEQQLEGQHIIEASAGTGKTYSIAILYLRMLLERDLKVEDILVVTFTNAAVAELRIRIRSFLQKAYRCLDNSHSEMEGSEIKAIIEKAKQLPQNNNFQLKKRLQLALDSMDHARINTIHSFCQQVLTEHSFATQQRFSLQLKNDIDDVIDSVCHQFWREVYAPLDNELLELNLINMKMLQTCFKNYLSGKEFASMQSNMLNLNDFKNYLEERKLTIQSKENDIEEKYEIYKLDHLTNFSKIGKDKNVIILKETLDDKHKFITNSKKFIEKELKRILDKLHPNFINAIKDLLTYKMNHNVLNNLLSLALNAYAPRLHQKKQEKGIATYDDLIQQLHQVIVKQRNESLIQVLREKNKAVFIDEFQDTDALQFEIFKTLFLSDNNQSSLFLIGDPKQSIYGFRGADVDSYLAAKNAISTDNHYSMAINYRSNATIIDAYNTFFTSIADPFANDQAIEYEEVKASENIRGGMITAEEGFKDFQILRYEKSGDEIQEAAKYIHILLASNNYQIKDEKSQEPRPILPSDIAVLVRSKFEGGKIKTQLQRRNIPSVQLMDTSVFSTLEAKGISYILEAMLQPEVGFIRKAFVGSFAFWAFKGMQEALERVEQESTIANFYRYQDILKNDEVFKALSAFLEDYGLRFKLTQNNKYLRSLANVEQILQILQEEQYDTKCSAQELLQWLYKKIQNADNEKEDYPLQIESEADAVNIVTIHKSKGLQYNIVFIIGLDKETTLNWDIIDFKKEMPPTNKKQIYYDVKKNLDISNGNGLLYKEQADQEDRRLLYVAMTRAKYMCCLFSNPFIDENKPKNYPSAEFMRQDAVQPFIKESDYIFDETGLDYKPHEQAKVIIKKVPGYIFQAYSNWSKLSYSAISAPKDWQAVAYWDEAQFPTPTTSNDYDTFIYETLKSNAFIGTKLHEVFENIQFHEDFSTFNNLSEKSIRQLDRFSKKDKNGQVIEDNSMYIQQLINHALNSSLQIENEPAFCLKEIAADKQLAELEFNFIMKTKKEDFDHLISQYEFPVRVKKGTHFKGLMNGFIDLFFEHNGRYYILDWKSNYLGNRLDFYKNETLIAAMETSNYHLQYLIYTVAAHKFLSVRVENYDYDLHFGGVFYLFLRGLRQGERSGIFSHRPNKQLIERMSEVLSDEKEMALDKI